MRDEMLGYYERELVYLRQMGADFARKYPKIAGRLLLEADKCEDPHVERMIEAFAFLASRVHLKIDDEFPEITEALLNVLYPHYLAPIPSMSIARFSLDPDQGKLTSGYLIERGRALYSRPVHGTPCRFRTCYPVVLWPLETTSVSLTSDDPVNSRGKWDEATIRIGIRCLNDTKLSTLRLGDERARPIDRLRFYISGEAQLVYPMYEILFNNVTRVALRPGESKKVEGPRRQPASVASQIVMPPSTLQPAGFERDEGMLPYTPRSFPGYRLLTEYFAFPEKFLFFDVMGLDKAASSGFGAEFEILIHLRDVAPPRSVVDVETFQLGCSPIVNLFNKTAEPIQLTQQQNEYHVIPDVHRQLATEIYSVDSVTTTDPYVQKSRQFEPFYSFRHAYDREMDRTFWYATRRESQRQDDLGTEVYLSLVDLDFDPNVPAVDTIMVHATCTNRDLPSKLPFGGKEGEFELEGAGPLSRVQCLKKPTNTLRPPLRHGAQWRLISHLSLNHISLVDGTDETRTNPLREILLLYDFTDSAATRKQINGIKDVATKRVVRQTGSRVGTGFVRGIETTITFDEQQYVGGGLLLFGSVLERFLALYTSINSFSQLAIKTDQSEGYLKRWRPRAGDQILL